MDTTIRLTGREPVPRIINVKQYSSGVDRVIFEFNPLPEGVGYVTFDGGKQALTLNGNKGVWNVLLPFTRQNGCVEIQLEFVDENTVWKSDLMLLIVSKSYDCPELQTQSGDGIVSKIAYVLGDKAIVDTDIVEKVIC